MPILIPGVNLIDLPLRVDERGQLFEVIRAYDMAQFGQVYVVTDPARGTVRAFHKHYQTIEYFCIVAGSAKFVLAGCDIPRVLHAHEDTIYVDQDTLYGLDTFTLTARKPQLLIVPAGVWHGWMSLEDRTILISVADRIYYRVNPDEVRIPPDSFGEVWTR